MKKAFLGIDTSCYRTSVAVITENSYVSERMLLPTELGEKGLRQSDALFLHIKQFPSVIENIDFSGYDIKAVGVSVSPTEEKGSYMPVFLCGKTVAAGIASAMNVPLYEFTHQRGHIRAAMIGNDIKPPFFAFHVSGGTTDFVRVDEEIRCTPVFKSSDLHAGQVIDRLGVSLGLPFPAGSYLEELALRSQRDFGKIPVSIKNGNPSLSGLQNKYEKMLADGETPEDTARFVFLYIAEMCRKMIFSADEDLPVLFSGGVMENSIIRESLEGKERYFAKSELCGDNAVGVAALTMDRYDRETAHNSKRS